MPFIAKVILLAVTVQSSRIRRQLTHLGSNGVRLKSEPTDEAGLVNLEQGFKPDGIHVVKNHPYGGEEEEEEFSLENPAVINAKVKASSEYDGSDIVVSLIEGLASFNFDEPIGSQLETLGVAVIGATLGTINPILGVTFSVLAGFLGWGGANEDQELIQDILDQVKDMIEGSITDFKHELNEARLDAILLLMSRTKNTSAWELLYRHEMLVSLPLLFGGCWVSAQFDEPPSEKCTEWRGAGGGGRALLYGIRFGNLMVSVATELSRIGSTIFDDVVNDIATTAKCLRQHLDAFHRYRIDQVKRRASNTIQEVFDEFLNRGRVFACDFAYGCEYFHEAYYSYTGALEVELWHLGRDVHAIEAVGRAMQGKSVPTTTTTTPTTGLCRPDLRRGPWGPRSTDFDQCNYDGAIGSIREICVSSTNGFWGRLPGVYGMFFVYQFTSFRYGTMHQGFGWDHNCFSLEDGEDIVKVWIHTTSSLFHDGKVSSVQFKTNTNRTSRYMGTTPSYGEPHGDDDAPYGKHVVAFFGGHRGTQDISSLGFVWG